MASPGHTIPPGEVRVTTLAVAEPETRAVSCVAGRDRTLVSGPPENLFPRAALDLSVERLRVRVDGAVREAPLLRPVVGKHYRVGTAVDDGTRLAGASPAPRSALQALCGRKLLPGAPLPTRAAPSPASARLPGRACDRPRPGLPDETGAHRVRRGVADVRALLVAVCMCELERLANPPFGLREA